MRCIFCKQDSSKSVSIEHIIPESLGNKNYTLPAGVVCDTCNNYFATKVEKYVLESDEFNNIRFNQIIKSKKGRYRNATLVFNNVRVNAYRRDKLDFVIPPGDFAEMLKAINKDGTGQILIPVSGTTPSDHYMSRFLAKCGFEAFASKILDTEGWNDFLVDYEGFDPIRKFSRFPARNEVWEFSKRRIYDENFLHLNANGPNYQVIFEWDILATGTPESSEYYFILAIFGMEYAINLGGESIDGYREWLKNNNEDSLLIMKKREIVC